MAEIVLRCDDCGLPWARIRNGVLMVESRHHGAKHTGVIPVAELVKMCQEGTPEDAKRAAKEQSRRQYWNHAGFDPQVLVHCKCDEDISVSDYKMFRCPKCGMGYVTECIVWKYPPEAE